MASVMFSSLISKFPVELDRDFFLREAIGESHSVEFAGYERLESKASGAYTNRARDPYRIAAFFDGNDDQIGTLYFAPPGASAGDPIDYHIDDEKSGLCESYVTATRFMEFLLAEHPDVAEYLLWYP